MNPPEQAPPHQLVADQPVETKIDPAAPEKGFCVHGKKNGKNLAIKIDLIPEKGVWVQDKENWKNLAIREALQSRCVFPTESAGVRLGKDFSTKSIQYDSLSANFGKSVQRLYHLSSSLTYHPKGRPSVPISMNF